MRNSRILMMLLSIVMVTTLHSCVDDDNAEPDIPGADRDKFVGSWLCRETVSGATPTTFTITIQKYGSFDSLKVLILIILALHILCIGLFPETVLPFLHRQLLKLIFPEQVFSVIQRSI
ncbi:MAG: hypothetical protein IPL22_01055 [Bacteroidetes bacterium]|nr:hypothetical protein [Bacteroidota bacterium]